MDAQAAFIGRTRLGRLAYLDNLKWFVVVLVVLMHLNVTYSGNGLWYYIERTGYGPLSGLMFGLYGSLTQAYFMGLLFFISGYLTPDSLERKGTGPYIRGRVIRLGIPMLVYVAVIHPLTTWIAGFAVPTAPDMAAWYTSYIVSLDFLLSLGPLWFLLVLLVLSVATALVWPHVGAPAPGERQPVRVRHGWVAGLALFIAVAAFLLRAVVPGGVPFVKALPGNFLQVGFFASYVILYVAGILCRTRGLLESIDYRFGMRWFWWTLILGIPLWFLGIPTAIAMAEAQGGVPDIGAFFGGVRWQSAFYATWESFFCVGVSLGLIVLFREKFNSQGRLTRFLSRNYFAVYVFHPPIIVAGAILARGIAAPPVLKMYVMAAILVPLCFVICEGLRQVPFIRRYFT